MVTPCMIFSGGVRGMRSPGKAICHSCGVVPQDRSTATRPRRRRAENNPDPEVASRARESCAAGVAMRLIHTAGRATLFAGRTPMDVQTRER